jgi:small-conductance mechanosensitive channel
MNNQFQGVFQFPVFDVPQVRLIQQGINTPVPLGEAQSLMVELWQGFLYRLPGLALGLLIMVLFILAAGPVSRLLLKPVASSSLTPLIKSVVQRSISVVIMLLGVYLFLFLAGLTGFAVAVISGTGVVGLILGFAFRDIAENFISSLLLTVQRPFKIGDIVQINEFTGIIQKVTARATTLVDFDGNHIQIPNATIYKGVIKNLTANPLMRGHFVLGVGYSADIKHAQSLALNTVNAHPNVLDDPEPQILIDNLGASTYNLKVYFWVNVENTSVLKMSSVLMRELVALYTQEGISMPDDARERIFPEGLVIHNGTYEGEHDNTREHQTIPSAKELSPTGKDNDIDASNASVNKGEKAQDTSHDDVSSEAHEIREQAQRARDPESGDNILS